MNENEIPENLKQAMQKYATAHELYDKDEKIKDLEEIKDELLRQVNDVDLQIEKLANKYMSGLDEVEEYITAQVMEIGNTVNHAGVQAKHVSGYTRSTWQKKMIDQILFDNPSLIPIFRPARKDTIVPPRVNVVYVGQPESVQYSREDYEASRAEVEN